MATSQEIERLKQQMDDLAKKVADSKQADVVRIRDALWLAGAGVILSTVLILVLAYHWTSSSASDIVAVAGVFTTLVGTVVGYFIGGGVGSQGKASSDQRANAADQRAAAAEQKASNARAFAQVVNEKLARHAGRGAMGLVGEPIVEAAAVKADMEELANLSEKLLQ